MQLFLFGSNTKMQELELRVPGMVRSRLPVFIYGESGTGKRAFAEHLHRSGGRGVFRQFRCSDDSFEALPTQFGAEGDTVFLQDIDRLAGPLQAGLLACLQRSGGRWILSSGLKRLDEMVRAGEFAPGLYDRLATFVVEMPPLRERQADLPRLLGMYSAAPRAGFPAAVIDAVLSYFWPGNIRELQELVGRYALEQDARGLIRELDRRRALAKWAGTGTPAGSLKDRVREAVKGLEAEIIRETLQKHHWNRRRTAQTLQISYRALLYKMKSCGLRSSANPAGEDGLC